MDASMTEQSTCRRGWPQIDCLPGNGSGGVPNDVDQSEREESRNESIGQVHEDIIIIIIIIIINADDDAPYVN